MKFNKLVTRTGTYRWNTREILLEKVGTSMNGAIGKRKRGDISASGSPEQEGKMLRKEGDKSA